MSQKHPTSQAVRKVAKRFRRAAGRADRVLNMSETNLMKNNESLLSWEDVRKEAPCGTIACHSGHYLIERIIEKDPDSYPHIDENNFDMCDFSDGVEVMTTDLGFVYPVGGWCMDNNPLLEWASENEDLWGNPRGGGMFVTMSAFWYTPQASFMNEHESYDLNFIAEHWEGVADRIEKLEKG